MCKNMRIETNGDYEYRTDLFERTARKLDENTKTGAIEAACMHANQDAEAKRGAMDYLSERLTIYELETVADILSTDQVPVEVAHEIEVGE